MNNTFTRSALSALLAMSLASAAVAQTTGDFDGDGFDDLIMHVTGEDIAGQSGAGAVNVVYGSGNGLRASGDQFWHQNSAGVKETSEAGDGFGFAVATGDFNGDGRDDAAIGADGEDLNGLSNVGVVHVLYGSSQGLRANGDQIWHRDVPGVTQDIGQGDYFGYSLATGDFDGDGFDDLAVSVLGDEINGEDDAGSLHIFYGSPNGITAAGDQVFSQDTPGIAEVAEASDYFAWHLAAGDFDGDGFDDLAASAVNEELNGAVDAGVVHVLYGSGNGLRATGDQLWHQDRPGIKGAVEASDNLGWFIAAGDFDGDGRDDLAIEVYREDVDGVSAAGAVAVLYGSNNGLSATGDQLWHQNVPGIRDTAGLGDGFGYGLAVGDFDGDGRDDLCCSVFDEDVDGVLGAGAAAVLYGSNAGLTAVGDQLIHKNTPGVNGVPGASESFGWLPGSGDFDGDGRDDLALGSNNADVGGANNAGALHVLYGANSGVTAVGDQVWTQNIAGIADTAEVDDNLSYGSPS